MIVITFFELICLQITAQNLFDRNWILSGSTWNSNLLQLTWNDKGLQNTRVVSKSKNGGLYNSVISNKDGNLLFFSNGCAIFDRDFHVIANGDTLNTGYIWDSYCGKAGFNTDFESILLLQVPSDTSRFIAFHTKAEDQYIFDSISNPLRSLSYSEIGLSKEHAFGEIVKKRVLVKEDTFYQGIYAVKHANGQDWWVILPQLLTLGFQRLLLTNAGVRYVGEQNIQHEIFGNSTEKGQGNFSLDGTKFAMGDPYSGIYIFDFDRCTGLFSNKRYIDIGFNKKIRTGLEFSPNSRFLYVALGDELDQYDLSAKDLLASKIEIDTFDGFPEQTLFFQSQLAPDGKIYIGSTNRNRYMSIIHQPDSLGLACDFRQHDLMLPDYYYVGLTNSPNFNLGATDPNCELPVSIKENKNTDDIMALVYPNPARDRFTIECKNLPNDRCQMNLYDPNGRYLFSQLIYQNKVNVHLPLQLVEGMYMWQITDGDRILRIGKLLLMER
ncbi:MAG: T9SS type A sorting domain-containing protein [Saprospiraceae bacterium]